MPKLSRIAQLSAKLKFVQDNLVEELMDYLDMDDVEDNIVNLFEAVEAAKVEYDDDEADDKEEDEDENEEDT